MIGPQAVGALDGIVISAVSHEGLIVTFNGRPAKLAIVAEDGRVIAAGDTVAREAEAVAVNCYRAFLKGKGSLRVHSKPVPPDEEIQSGVPRTHRRSRCAATSPTLSKHHVSQHATAN